MNKNILNRLFSVIDKKHVITAIHYGNKNGSDIDIFVTTSHDVYYERKTKSNLDLTIVGIKYLVYLMSVFDPIVTEPILTGEVIYGAKIDKEKSYLISINPNQDTTIHLVNFASQILQAAKEYFSEENYSNALINTVFCLSYINFAKYYKINEKVITFKKLLANNCNTLLNNTYYYMKTEKINKKVIRLFLNSAEKELTSTVDELK